MHSVQRTLKLLFAVVALSAVSTHAAALTVDLVSDPGGTTPALVAFNGSNLSFVNASDSFGFIIAGSSDPTLVGLRGTIGGTFTIGPITTLGPAQSAPVSDAGTGSLSIRDGGGNTLSAHLSLNGVSTFKTAVGFNGDALANLDSFSYTGTNHGLLSLMSSVDPTITLSAQFLPAKSLSDLTDGKATYNSTYSGTMSAAVPEPSSYLLLAVGLCAIGISLRRRQLD